MNKLIAGLTGGFLGLLVGLHIAQATMIVDAGPDQYLPELTGSYTNAQLNGSASTDTGTLITEWTYTGTGTALIQRTNQLQTNTRIYNNGPHEFTLTANDGINPETTDTMIIYVGGEQPSVTPTPTPSVTPTPTPTPTGTPTPTPTTTECIPLGDFGVSQTPLDNLVTNQWFQDSNGNESMVDWEISIPGAVSIDKWAQPAYNEYTTAAKIGPNSGGMQINTDYYVTQDVIANPNATHLSFNQYFVTVRPNVFELDVYGSTDGINFTHVWKPFIETNGIMGNCWEERPATTTLESGYPIYRLEYHGNFPNQSIGMKWTGVYFSATE